MGALPCRRERGRRVARGARCAADRLRGDWHARSPRSHVAYHADGLLFSAIRSSAWAADGRLFEGIAGTPCSPRFRLAALPATPACCAHEAIAGQVADLRRERRAGQPGAAAALAEGRQQRQRGEPSLPTRSPLSARVQSPSWWLTRRRWLPGARGRATPRPARRVLRCCAGIRTSSGCRRDGEVVSGAAPWHSAPDAVAACASALRKAAPALPADLPGALRVRHGNASPTDFQPTAAGPAASRPPVVAESLVSPGTVCAHAWPCRLRLQPCRAALGLALRVRATFSPPTSKRAAPFSCWSWTSSSSATCLGVRLPALSGKHLRAIPAQGNNAAGMWQFVPGTATPPPACRSSQGTTVALAWLDRGAVDLLARYQGSSATGAWSTWRSMRASSA